MAVDEPFKWAVESYPMGLENGYKYLNSAIFIFVELTLLGNCHTKNHRSFDAHTKRVGTITRDTFFGDGRQTKHEIVEVLGDE